MAEAEWIMCKSSTIWGYRWLEGNAHPLQIRYKRKREPGATKGYGYAAPRNVYDGLVKEPGSKGIYVDRFVKKPGYDYVPLD